MSVQRRKRRIADPESDDPLAGVANFFDLGVVFALGFLVALLGYLGMSTLPVRADALTLQHYRTSEEATGGKGTRLGTAYRLENGEVVYVPDGR